MGTEGKSKKNRTVLMIIAIFCIYMLIQMRYIGETWFDPDELDIYGTGFEMFKGKVLYSEIASQHMPWSYVISMIFYALGAHSTVLQRLYFYIMFAAFWTAFIFIYKKHVNKWVLFLQPFAYFAIIQHLDFGTQILSENIAVIGAQMLLLEFLMFLDKREVSLASCIRISLGVILTFGVSFVDIYAVFYMVIGVILLEIAWYRNKVKKAKAIDNKAKTDNKESKETEEKKSKQQPSLAKTYIRLVAVVALPWIALLIYMLATHSVGAFIKDAYTVNREYYPRYMANIGAEPMNMFDVGITRIAEYINEFSFEGFNTLYILKLFIVGCLIFTSYKLVKTKGWIAGITVFMFVSSLGIRGLYSFHTVTFIGAATLVTVYAMVTYLYESKKAFEKKSEGMKFLLVFMSCLFVASFSENLHSIFHFLKMEDMNGYKKECEIVKTITDEDERIWQTNVCNSVSWGSLRVTKGPTISTPWMWDAVGSEKFEAYKADPARVIIFEDNYESWGNKMSDYAPEAYTYIKENYTYIPDSNQVWVLNSYYDEACSKLGIN